MKKNPLLAVTIISLAGYWSVGWFIPGFILSSAMSVFSILIGAAVLVRYSTGFYNVLFRHARSKAQDGAHLAALGIPSIAASIVWGGLFTLSWNIAGQPEHWLATPASNFSRVMLIAGCIALYLTPDVQKERLSLPGVMWLAAIMLTAVFTAFILGAYVGNDAVNGLFSRASYSTCPGDRPLWAASGSHLYHGPDSPYRMLVKPRMCFRTDEEAQEAGFRPVVVLTSRAAEVEKAVP